VAARRAGGTAPELSLVSARRDSMPGSLPPALPAVIAVASGLAVAGASRRRRRRRG
jgi:hypothetical protein